MEDTYESFIKNGATIYTARVDSLKAIPGRNRIKLTWLLVSDPKITKNVVYWNDKADSVVLNVTKTAHTDTITTIIPNLADQTYTFQVYTYDNYGHHSVKAEIIGTVYGDLYANTILNRPLNTTVLNTTTNNLAITWWGVSSQAVALDMKYTDISGASKTVTDVPIQDPNINSRVWVVLPAVSNLPNFKKGSSFSYRTGYKPVPTSIDTFYTDWTTVTVP
ncbi:MAG: DUF4998 domain-containing protein [Bacteroidota bacterium]|nr:DUF4998 domain-containing protein [Bacteroidota bacterium]MDP4290522.1 DUF4998 domain-containing protein [Bacteroidota bacterium]